MRSHRIGRARVALAVLGPLVAVGLAAATWPVRAGAQTSQPRVLVLYSTRRDAQLVVTGERELPRILDAGLGRGIDYYSEYIDSARFPDSGYRDALAELMRQKYRGRQFDVVIALDFALDLVALNRQELFGDSPVVFFSNSTATARPPNSTGVMFSLDYSGTAELATELQPSLKHLFVITGAAPIDIATEKRVREQLQAFGSRLEIVYLTGLPTSDLEARLKTLPPQSAVYYVLVDQDGAGVNFHPLTYLDRVVAASSAPVYSWVDSTMGRGIVGGSLKDQAAQIDAVAELALRVLRGERADDIPLESRDLNVRQVDWRALRKWNISEAAVPADTLIKFREPSLWGRYRGYVIGAGIVLVAQTALIAGLLVQRRQRRKAEELASGREAEIQRSYDRIRDLAVRLLNAQEGERARIARELHDDISQQLALLAIDLEILNTKHTEALMIDAVGRAQAVARSVHDLSHRLHPAKLRLIGLVPALAGLQKDPNLSGIATTFVHDNVPANLAPELTLCLFRIVQESLQNAAKYSQAHNVSVHLSGRTDGVVLTVADDGVGFDVDREWGKGLGLVSMAERVDAIGGRMTIQSRPGEGTQLNVTVPFKAADPSQSVAM